MAHVDDSDRAAAYQSLLADDRARLTPTSSPVEQAFARMLLFSLWPSGGFESYEAGLASLRQEPAVRDEIRSVVDLAFDNTRHLTASTEAASRA